MSPSFAISNATGSKAAMPSGHSTTSHPDDHQKVNTPTSSPRKKPWIVSASQRTWRRTKRAISHESGLNNTFKNASAATDTASVTRNEVPLAYSPSSRSELSLDGANDTSSTTSTPPLSTLYRHYSESVARQINRVNTIKVVQEDEDSGTVSACSPKASSTTELEDNILIHHSSSSSPSLMPTNPTSTSSPRPLPSPPRPKFSMQLRAEGGQRPPRRVNSKKRKASTLQLSSRKRACTVSFSPKQEENIEGRIGQMLVSCGREAPGLGNPLRKVRFTRSPGSGFPLRRRRKLWVLDPKTGQRVGRCR